MQHEQPVHYEDVAGVKSRVSWGAVMAGSVVTLAAYLLFSLLLAGLGLAISDSGIDGRSVGLGTVLVGVFCMGLALFAGGWVTTQLTAGETKCESIVYGILTWATVTAISLYMVGWGVSAGYHGLLGAAYATQALHPEITQDNWELTARRGGVPDDKIADIKSRSKSGWTADRTQEVQDAINDPVNRENAKKATMMTIWTALVGTILAIGCAIAGAIVGSGPEFRLIPTTRNRQQVVMNR